mgnify:CR=1 FL=1|tara:strand:+ start:2499 stop:3149 length:651 start_codon:yes stop_codon:yes gene_type:complete
MKEGFLRLLNGKKLRTNKSNNLRPTSNVVREALVNIIRKDIINSSWLDLCSGSGAIASEAIIHGAKKVYAIEKDKKNAALCKFNIFSIPNSHEKDKDIRVFCSDSIKWIKKYSEIHQDQNNKIAIKNKFDFFYIDPPYIQNLYLPIMQEIFNSKIYKKSSLIICECSAKNEISVAEEWIEVINKKYGNTRLLFFTLNQAFHHLVDIDSKQLQTNLE